MTTDKRQDIAPVIADHCNRYGFQLETAVENTDGRLTVILAVDSKTDIDFESARLDIEDHIRKEIPDIQSITVILTAETAGGSDRRSPPTNHRPTDQDMLARPVAPDVKRIIAVASGKGGVGKSTVAANLALALADTGLSVGLVDADIYGPSQHRMFRITKRATAGPNRTLIPAQAHGIRVISLGMLTEDDRPVIWRGPMVQTAVLQFFRDVIWGETDILVVDLPPGTGDAQMTLAQKIPLSGAVIVSTPQDIALIDAIKGMNMFLKMKVPVLGMVENMAQHICSNCGHIEHIFGQDGAVKVAEARNVPLLGQLPLDIKLRETSDGGTPIVLSDPDHPAAVIFRDMARTLRKVLFPVNEKSGGL